MRCTEGSGHTMRVVLEYETVRLLPVCHEPEGAVCRVTCAVDSCESYDYPEHEHGLKPVPYCNAVEDLTADDSTVERCGVSTEVPLRDGMRIDMFWEGDHYSWSPSEPSGPIPS